MQHHRANGSFEWWTSEADATLTRLVAEGHTMGVMAKQIGKSRCAIAGRMKRLGLTSKSGQGVGIGARFGKRKAKSALPRPPKPKAIPALRVKRGPDSPYGAGIFMQKMRTDGKPRSIELPALPEEAAPLGLTLMELTDATCKWPTSGEGADTRFCGHSKLYGSYCAAHAVRNVGAGTQGERSAEREARAAA